MARASKNTDQPASARSPPPRGNVAGAACTMVRAPGCHRSRRRAPCARAGASALRQPPHQQRRAARRLRAAIHAGVSVPSTRTGRRRRQPSARHQLRQRAGSRGRPACAAGIATARAAVQSAAPLPPACHTPARSSHAAAALFARFVRRSASWHSRRNAPVGRPDDVAQCALGGGQRDGRGGEWGRAVRPP